MDIVDTINKVSDLVNNYSKLDSESLSELNSYSIAYSFLDKMGLKDLDFVKEINSIEEDNSSLYKVNDIKKKDNSLDFTNSIDKINPQEMMIAMALYKIECDLNDIKDSCDKIISFLENDKESEIEGDLELLNRIIKEFKYNFKDKTYLTNNHKHVMDIKRTSLKNINFYKKEIDDVLDKDKKFMMNNNISKVQSDLENNLKYYKLSTFIYSFSTFLEIILLGNFSKDYLASKKEELINYDNSYLDYYNKSLDFISREAEKSVEGNVLKGIGSAGKALGGFVNKISFIKDKNIDEWLDKSGENLENKGQEIKDEFKSKFEKLGLSNLNSFTNKIDEIDNIYNNITSIYFDSEKFYIEFDKN